ncbi:hypothetical protein ACFE04_024957 [Oxalis oulophora]
MPNRTTTLHILLENGMERGDVVRSAASRIEAYCLERVIKIWRRQISVIEVAVDSVVEAVESGYRGLTLVIDGKDPGNDCSRGGSRYSILVEMDLKIEASNLETSIKTKHLLL